MDPKTSICHMKADTYSFKSSTKIQYHINLNHLEIQLKTKTMRCLPFFLTKSRKLSSKEPKVLTATGKDQLVETSASISSATVPTTTSRAVHGSVETATSPRYKKTTRTTGTRRAGKSYRPGEASDQSSWPYNYGYSGGNRVGVHGGGGGGGRSGRSCGGYDSDDGGGGSGWYGGGN